jgi:hypothetical protein
MSWLLFLGAIGLLQYYNATNPSIADAATGRVHAMNLRGNTTYLTMTENLIVSGLMVSGVGCGVLLRYLHRHRADPK